MLSEIGLSNVKAEDILHVIEDAKGKGYGISSQDELGEIFLKYFHGIKESTQIFS